ncbi:hypothetical protein BAB79_21980 [Mycobacteroides abscessus]|nr:hypothetical protein A3O06_21985 [Mycobacteroides abscessus]ANO25877.1 hypothetical protein BAB79_21980 [Mycobacteroides abscessus]
MFVLRIGNFEQYIGMAVDFTEGAIRAHTPRWAPAREVMASKLASNLIKARVVRIPTIEQVALEKPRCEVSCGGHVAVGRTAGQI